MIESAKTLAIGLNNLRVIDLTLLRNSRMILTVAGMNLLLEGLFEPSVKYNCPTDGYAWAVCQGDKPLEV